MWQFAESSPLALFIVTAQVVNQVAPAKHGHRGVAPELGEELGLT
jgi:hypothetical protein